MKIFIIIFILCIGMISGFLFKSAFDILKEQEIILTWSTFKFNTLPYSVYACIGSAIFIIVMALFIAYTTL